MRILDIIKDKLSKKEWQWGAMVEGPNGVVMLDGALKSWRKPSEDKVRRMAGLPDDASVSIYESWW